MTPQVEPTPAAEALDTEALDLVVGGVELYCRKTGGQLSGPQGPSIIAI